MTGLVPPSYDIGPNTLSPAEWTQDLQVKAMKKLQDYHNRTPVEETVNHPDHYKAAGIEAIDVIEGYSLGFNLGNTVKYILRAGRKSDKVVEDLKKARWYLDREISNREKNV